jgi:hypothetical protein
MLNSDSAGSSLGNSKVSTNEGRLDNVHCALTWLLGIKTGPRKEKSNVITFTDAISSCQSKSSASLGSVRRLIILALTNTV